MLKENHRTGTSGSRFTQTEYETCKPYQRINHFPKTAIITRKDNLFRTLKTMRAIHGAVYDFFPQSFSLPNDYVKFVRVYAEEEEKGRKVVPAYKPTWICKPADLSRGRKISVFRNIQELSYDCNAVLQRYIPNPILISGYKYDMRCYVCVRSYNPLNIYLYNEGLTRFATNPYDLTDLSNRFSHLTNTSINKLNPDLQNDKLTVGPGCKWPLAKLRRYFDEQGLPFAPLWERMKAIVVLTLLPVAVEAVAAGVGVGGGGEGCFEVYGFDIIVDEQLRPWLLEVNLSPALSVDSEVDVAVKAPMLKDVIELSGITKEDAASAVAYEVLASYLSPSSASKKKQPTKFPSTVGGFEKIFPFDTDNAIVDKTHIKSVVQAVKKTFFP
ncbi:putative tubulin polyglutamylase ttll2 [Podochytrium sp. JEL0797]|nr:putative tubulin polyglutamylase ttll2 [Podochytrium sp. JEL0797]